MKKFPTALIVLCGCILAAGGLAIYWCVRHYERKVTVTVTSLKINATSQPTTAHDNSTSTLDIISAKYMSHPTTWPKVSTATVTFESDAERQKTLAALKGKTIRQAMEMLPTSGGGALIGISAVGNDPNKLAEMVDEVVARARDNSDGLPDQGCLMYDVSGPTKGTLSIDIEDGKVTSATFTPAAD